MAVKQLAFEADARAGLLAGVEKLAAAVKPTLGPRGRNAILDKSWGGPTVTKADDIINIASVSANNDPEIGKIMAEAFQRVGKDGVITVEEGKSFDTAVEFVEGMQFDRGYLSPHFVTDPDHMLCELEKPYIF